METIFIDLGLIHPNDGQLEGLPKNPRFIRDNKYKKLVQSIKDDPEMLELRELLVYDTGDPSLQYIIVGGNMRYRAIKELGYTEAPCKVIPTGFSIEKMRRIVLKDNSSFGEMDFEALINEWSMEEIESAAIDVPDIEEPEIEEEAKDDNYDVEANTPEEPKARLGDIYMLGEHRLICGDSTKDKYVEAVMCGEMADLLLTDPPYNVNYEGGTGLKIQNDNMEDSVFLNFLHDAFQTANRNMREGAAFYIWHADSEGYNFRTASRLVGWKVRQCLIWNKNALVLGRQDYQWKHEPCLYGWKDGAAHYFVDKRNLTTVIEQQLKKLEDMTKDEMKELLKQIQGEMPVSVIDCNKPSKNEDHPTMKPVPLIGQQMLNSTRRGDIVLDLFGGSGTTLIAAEQLGRKCRMVEYDPKYVDVIIKRWEKMTGDKAELLTNIDDGTADNEEKNDGSTAQ